MTTCLLQKGQIKIFTGTKSKITDVSKDTGANLSNIYGFTQTSSGTKQSIINITNMPQQMVNGVLSGSITDKFTQAITAPHGYTDINGGTANFSKYQTNGVAVIGVCTTAFSRDTLTKFGVELNNIKGIILGPGTTVTIGYLLHTKDGSLTNQINNQSVSFTSTTTNSPKCVSGLPLARGYMIITKEDINDKMVVTTNYTNTCVSTNNPPGCMLNHTLPLNSVPFITSISVSYSNAVEKFDSIGDGDNNNSIATNQPQGETNVSMYITLLIIVLLLILILLVCKYM